MRALRTNRAPRALLAAVIASALASFVLAGVAQAAGAPSWRIEARSAPSLLPASGESVITVVVTNFGTAPATGEKTPIVIKEKLPAGVKELSAQGEREDAEHSLFPCELKAETVVCTLSENVPPYEAPYALIRVTDEGLTLGSLANTASVEGGGASSASTSEPFQVGTEATHFGIERFEMQPEEEDGTPDTRAGSHPYQLTTKLNLDESLELDTKNGETLPSTPQPLKDVQVKLPPGLIGNANPSVIPQCSDHDFSTIESNGNTNACPASTAVGVAIVEINEPNGVLFKVLSVPVFSLVPAPGEPARFGFEAVKDPVLLDTAVASGADYSVITSVKNASEAAAVFGSTVILWGEPGAESHDTSRGWECLIEGHTYGHEPHCETPSPRITTPFLAMPTSCNQQTETSLLVDSWIEPGAKNPDGTAVEGDPRWKGASAPLAHFDECGALPFSPELKEVLPAGSVGNTPDAFTVDVHLPQASTLEAEGLSEAAVRETVVTLPPGVELNPSAANTINTCSEGLVGFTGSREFEPGIPMFTFTSSLPEPLAPGANFCPNASKVGIVHIRTPDLPNELEGGVYLAEQPNGPQGGPGNPFGSLFAMYIVAEDPVSKTLVKLAGEVRTDPATGQVTTVFRNTPQVGFEDLKLELFGGPGASLSTPPQCGTYTTTSSFAPWSGTPPQGPQASFNITSGAEGSGCPNPMPLAPGFNAGTTNNLAGEFSPFELTLTHPDADQAPTNLTVTLPPGIAAMLSRAELCKEAEANAGTCGPGSLIGEATATAGLGSTPFTETGGRVYITEKYTDPRTGATSPFGLSVVIPTHAGPFDFGNVVTRSQLFVDENTAAVTISSELPTMVNTVNYATGVPVQLKEIHVVVNKPEFQFNATNCTPAKITATVTGVQGTVAPVSSNYQPANCAALPFHPEFSAETESHFTKQEGTGLVIHVKYPKGKYANIAKTKVAFPEVLPSRLSTLQHSCIDKTFEQNPALCPQSAIVGTATAYTPVLKNPLTGPAYLVSHGNAAFPDAEFLLQGEGITLLLDGSTAIKHGVTTSTFESVPDAPVGEFIVDLPRGPHSAFTGYGNLCKPVKEVTSKVRVAKKVGHKTIHVLRKVTKKVPLKGLIMPTTITAQNGKVIQQETMIKVAGCKAPIHHTTKKTSKKKKHKKKKKKK